MMRMGLRIGGGVLALGVIIGVCLWLRYDAVRDHQNRINKDRLETIREGIGTRDEINSLDDCDLLNRLLDRMPGIRGSDVFGCRDESAPDESGDGEVSRPQ